uniref:Retrovirus-related Pol polyprotein from transposon TNT 1-94 n=1 Tax=Cajanus cajan TaxID=3821 RepID=A0A151THK7_CAJCA|nr:Retrovirus-related Pol polyprotein from transposon TNT 1-94 [Cajanus cajan]
MAEQPKYHPALTISNVKLLVPVTLDNEQALYHSWAALFTNLTRVHDLYDHLVPPTEPSVHAAYIAAKSEDPAMWKRLDAAILQWIYGTISPDLLLAILRRDDTAEGAWKRLEALFQDNKASRATHLEEEFTNATFEDHNSIDAYCTYLQSIADRLADVDAPVTNGRLVLRLTGSLPEAYSGTVDFIQNQEPLPSFDSCRSRLKMAERTTKARLARESIGSGQRQTAAMLAASNDSAPKRPSNGSPTNPKPRYHNKGKGKYKNSGQHASQPSGRPSQQQAWPTHQHQQSWPQWQPGWGGWTIPPCPFPTQPWQPRPNYASPKSSAGHGILGPKPQVFNAMTSSSLSPTPTYTPTDIEAAMHALSFSQPDGNYYMDTGATSHMTSDAGILSSYFNSSNKTHNIVVGSGHLIPIIGHGRTNLPPPHPPFLLNNVLHAPKLIKNLISVRKFTTDNWVSILFDPFGFSVHDLQTGTKLMRCNSVGDLYPLFPPSQATLSNPSVFTTMSRDIWHNRLGHPGNAIINSLRSNKFIECNKACQSFCSSCPIGKHVKLPFYDSSSYTVLPFDIIHSDLWTSPIASTSGHRYYILFLDDYSKFLWTFPIAKKSQVPHLFLSFHALVKTQFERSIKTFQCDNGTEYVNGTLKQFFDHNGLLYRLSCPHTSPQNGKAERHIRSINNIIRTILHHASMPLSFWHHALSMATYLLNILPSKVLNYLSPTQILYQGNPSYSDLRTFGCLCFPLFPSTTINKLQERSTPCVYLGPAPNHRGSKCYEISSGKIIICRHVRFVENEFPFSKVHKPKETDFDCFDASLPYFIHQKPQNTIPNPLPQNTQTAQSSSPSTSSRVNLASSNLPSPLSQPTSSTQTHSSPPSSRNIEEIPLQSATSPNLSNPSTIPHPTSTDPSSSQRITTRSANGIFKPNPKYFSNFHTATTPNISPIPKTPVSALHDQNWKNAMLDEFNALIDNKTWVLVPRPPNVNVIRSMWIFRHKHNADGSFERYKARLVGNGNTQQQGVDCDETFSPVVKPATIRTVLSIALSKSWPIHQMDVKNAFLHGHLNETVYMHQPMGFRNKEYPDHVCLLQKSLYGLKQAPRAWYQRFAAYVATIGFTNSKSDTSLFIYRNKSDIAYLLLYVDDIILTASSDRLRKYFMALLGSEFAMKDLGPLSYFLGISVTRHPHGLFLSQTQYAKTIIERAGMSNCSTCPTPVDTKPKLSANSATAFADPTKYRSLAGALQYLTFTRPDISYAVQQICLHMHAPTNEHMSALKRILRYLQGTLSHGLHLHNSSIDRLISYTDADWGGCPDTRRSTSGYCVFLGDNLISWSSKRQPTLSRSSAEAEYRGVANVVSDSCWLFLFTI